MPCWLFMLCIYHILPRQCTQATSFCIVLESPEITHVSSSGAPRAILGALLARSFFLQICRRSFARDANADRAYAYTPLCQQLLRPSAQLSSSRSQVLVCLHAMLVPVPRTVPCTLRLRLVPFPTSDRFYLLFFRFSLRDTFTCVRSLCHTCDRQLRQQLSKLQHPAQAATQPHDSHGQIICALNRLACGI